MNSGLLKNGVTYKLFAYELRKYIYARIHTHTHTHTNIFGLIGFYGIFFFSSYNV